MGVLLLVADPEALSFFGAEILDIKIDAHFVLRNHHVVVNEVVVQVVELVVVVGLWNLLLSFLLLLPFPDGLRLVPSVLLNGRQAVVKLQPGHHGFQHVFKFKAALVRLTIHVVHILNVKLVRGQRSYEILLASRFLALGFGGLFFGLLGVHATDVQEVVIILKVK